MPPPSAPDRGLVLLVALALGCAVLAGVELASGLPTLAAVLLLVPVIAASYRDRRLGLAAGVLAGAAYFGLALLFLAPLSLGLALTAVAVALIGLLFAGTMGSVAEDAATYAVWYHGVYDRLPGATLFMMPATGRVHALNGGAEALLGRVRGRSLEEAFADSGAYAAFTKAVQEEGGVERMRIWLLAADGDRRWCELAGGMVNPVLAVVRIEDRTAEWQAADALAESEQDHRRLAEQAPELALLIDDALRVVAGGGGTLAAFTGSDEPIAGRTVWTAFPERVAQAVEPLARLAAFGTAGVGEVGVDGRLFRLAARPVIEDGLVRGAALTAADVSVYRERQEELENEKVLADALLSLHRAGGERAMDRLLGEAVRLTGSRVGFVARTDGGIVLEAWSPAVSELCTVREAGHTFGVEGLFGEVLRTRAPLVLNDLPAVVRERLPKGHLPLHRLLAVPVVRDDEVIGVVAVADRVLSYTDRESNALNALADEGFGLVAEKQRAATAARETAALEAAFEGAGLPLLLVDREGDVRRENAAARELFGVAAPAVFHDRVRDLDRNRVRTAELRRRHSPSQVPAQYEASVIGEDGGEHAVLIVPRYLRGEDRTLVALLDLGPLKQHGRCRARAAEALEDRLGTAIGRGGALARGLGEEEPIVRWITELKAAWTETERARLALADPPGFGPLPPECGDYS